MTPLDDLLPYDVAAFLKRPAPEQFPAAARSSTASTPRGAPWCTPPSAMP